MLPTQTRRIKPSVLQADRDAEVTLESLADYKPANDAFSLANVKAALAAMQAAQQAELRIQAEFDTARDNAVEAEWRFHEVMLNAKVQVIAQYGKSSNELQSLGLKKKTEYKKPVRVKPKPA